MQAPHEQSLVRALSNGSVNAFNVLYKQYCDPLFGFSFTLLRDREKAEGVVQHVFLKVWEKRSTLNPELSFQNYIHRIAKNHVIKLIYNTLKEKERIIDPEDHTREQVDSDPSVIVFSELKSRIRREVRNLPRQRRKVFVMSRNFNLTHKEISENLLISVNTVKRHMNLALKTLNQALLT